MTCPNCGRQEATGEPKEIVQTYLLLNSIPIYRTRRTWVFCGACRANLGSRLPLEDLVAAGPQERQAALYAEVSPLGRVVIILSLLLFAIPGINVLLALVGLAMSVRYRTMMRVVAATSVGVGLVSSYLMWDLFTGNVGGPDAPVAQPAPRGVAPFPPTNRPLPPLSGKPVRPPKIASLENPEPERLTSDSPRAAADELVKRFGQDKVVRLVIRSRPELRDDPKLIDKLARACDRGSKPCIYISPSGDPIAVALAPVSSLNAAWEIAMGFGPVEETDRQQRMITVSLPSRPSRPGYPTPGDMPTMPPMPTIPGVPGQPATPASGDALSQAVAQVQAGGLMRHVAIDRIAALPVDEKRRDEVARLLAGLLTGTDTFVRMSAAKALGKWWTAETLPALVALAGDADPSVRWQAMDALAATRTEDAAKAIAAQLGAPGGMRAARALATMGPVAEPAALELLASNDEHVRSEACRVLQTVGTAKSLSRLKALSRDQSMLVRMAADAAVRAINARK